MARPREPIDLIKAKGKKHLSEKEYEERKSQEIQVPFTDVKPPTYLNKEQKKEFKEIAGRLQAIDKNLFTELDVDTLCRYLQAKQLYFKYTKELNKVIDNPPDPYLEDYEIAYDGYLDNINKLQRMQDIVFKQCQTSARDLGLNISSRCKIILPPQENDGEDYEL